MKIPNILKIQSITGTLRKVVEGALRTQSASEFLQNLARVLQGWMDEQAQSGRVAGMRSVLMASLPGGREVQVCRLSAHGQSLIKLEGLQKEGPPFLILSHHHSIQFFATFIPQAPEEGDEQREIGFHTLIIEDEKIGSPD